MTETGGKENVALHDLQARLGRGIYGARHVESTLHMRYTYLHRNGGDSTKISRGRIAFLEYKQLCSSYTTEEHLQSQRHSNRLEVHQLAIGAPQLPASLIANNPINRVIVPLNEMFAPIPISQPAFPVKIWEFKVLRVKGRTQLLVVQALLEERR